MRTQQFQRASAAPAGRSACGTHLKFWQLILRGGGALLIALALAAPGFGQSIIQEKHEKTVVLDPGHGGHEVGARGTLGATEKEVALNMARLLAVELGDALKVVLTRTDDFSLDIFERTSVANHHEADLFISLHTGGSFTRSVSGAVVYYFDPPAGLSMQSEPEIAESPKETETVSWNRLQNAHQQRSKEVADLMTVELRRVLTHMQIETRGANLAVLQGADMPAVLVEIGYLTNPADEKALVDEAFLQAVAKALANAAKAFLQIE